MDISIREQQKVLPEKENGRKVQKILNLEKAAFRIIKAEEKSYLFEAYC